MECLQSDLTTLQLEVASLPTTDARMTPHNPATAQNPLKEEHLQPDSIFRKFQKRQTNVCC